MIVLAALVLPSWQDYAVLTGAMRFCWRGSRAPALQIDRNRAKGARHNWRYRYCLPRQSSVGLDAQGRSRFGVSGLTDTLGWKAWSILSAEGLRD
jgi:hypothetical protein